MHLRGIRGLPGGSTVAHTLRQNRLMAFEFCVAVLFLNVVLAGHSVAQSSEPAAAATQEPASSPQPATAEPQSTTPPQTRVRATRRRPTIDDHVKTLAKSLNLTEAQQAAVKKILEQRQLETLRLRTDANISGSQRIDRLRALQDQTVLRIRGVLDDEQKKKYDPLAVRNLTPAPDQKSVEDWIKATTPK